MTFGEHLAGLHKGQSITQVQLAEQLGVSQQAVTAYESGQRRIPISLLPLLARTLHLTLEELVGDKGKPSRTRSKRGPAPTIQQQLEQIEALPKAKQRAIAKVLDSMLGQG